MPVTIERQGDTLIAAADGRVDSTNASTFQDELTAATDGNDHSVILDLGGLSYISSAGLRVILLVAKTLQTKGAKFVVCSPSDQIREIFEISGFSQIIPVYGSGDEAITAFNS
jgi:stage II sporulation protein AA (anti-sigma F factor antagonist)